MNKIALMVAILAYSIFAADMLYLKDGKEIKDVSIVEIRVSDVKYKVGKKEILYTVRKSDIAIIFYSDGTKEVCSDGGYYYSSSCSYESDATYSNLGTIFFLSGAVWNIYRSASYDKPKNVAYSKYGGST